MLACLHPKPPCADVTVSGHPSATSIIRFVSFVPSSYHANKTVTVITHPILFHCIPFIHSLTTTPPSTLPFAQIAPGKGKAPEVYSLFLFCVRCVALRFALFHRAEYGSLR